MKIKIKIIVFLILTTFLIPKNVFAMDIPVFSLIVSAYSSGYVCLGNSIGCSSLSSIYKIEKRDENIYVCPKNSGNGCLLLDTIYKTSKKNADTTYVCSSSSFGVCSVFNVLYKISKHDEKTSYVCLGDSIGDCSIFNTLYKISKYDDDTTFACPGDSIGNCSIFNVLYKFKKTDTQSSGYSGTDYSALIKAEQEKLAQLEQEKQKLTEDYLNELSNLNTPKYSCPANSTLSGTTCICNEGYTSNGTACITYTQNCQVHFGINSYGDKQNCYCSSGYEFNNDQSLCVASITCPLNSTKIGQSCVCNDDFILKNEQCITYTQDCINNFGLNVYGIKGDNGNSSCYCKDGYEWNASQTACIKSVICPLNFKKVNNECVCDNNYIKKNNNCITPTEDCVDKYGSYIYGIISASKNDSSCFCLEGYEWNTSKTACVKKTEEKQIIKKASQTQTQQEQPQKNKPEDKKELVENIEIEKQAVNEFQEQPKEHSEKQKPQENQQAEQKKEQEKGHSMFSAGIFDAIRSVFRMFLSWF